MTTHPRGRMAKEWRGAGLVFLSLLSPFWLSGDAGAQERGDTAAVADSVAAVALPDSLIVTAAGDTVPVDSLSLRERAALGVRGRLRALARPPGLAPDTTAGDSTALARAARAAGSGRGAAAGGDDVEARLGALEGYTVTRYEGEGATWDAVTETLLLRGGESQARVIDAEGELRADSLIRYQQGEGVAFAWGNPVWAQEGSQDEVTSDSLAFDIQGRRGSAFNARTRYNQGGGTTWNVTGDLPVVGEDVLYGHDTHFTSCDLETPHYHFQTDELKIVKGSVLVARPVRLYFADVPVAWLPFVAQSLGEGRASGLLTPRFSVNDIVRTSGGYRRRISNVGFYWAMSDYTDATMAFDWFDDNYTALTGSFRYRWLRQFLDGSLNVRQYWRDAGQTELTLDTQNRWEMSERTQVTMQVAYASSSEFVRQNSFDPREITQEITSQGGVNRRFDWGSLAVSANRAQDIATDRVRMTLPSVNLSLRPVTLFAAPPTRSSWFNNITWNGSARAQRSLVDEPTDTLGFSFGTADRETVDASLNSGLTIGSFSFSQTASYREGRTLAVPRDSLDFFPSELQEHGMRAFDGQAGRTILGQQAEPGSLVDVADARLAWSLGLDFQQKLVGTTTFTPRLDISGESRRVDTMEVAQDFVAGPRRISFGAGLKADVYGFYPGFGEFEAIRHKLSPSFTFDWSPGSEPTELQDQVFGARARRPKQVMSLGLNQTWEAKRPPQETTQEPSGATDADTAADPAAADTAADTTADTTDTTAEAADTADTADAADADADPSDDPTVDPGEEPAGIDDTPQDGEPRRLEQGQIVNLLSLNTSVVEYDFVDADSLGGFLQGFTSTTLQNQISSDFLRGLSVRVVHDLFEDETTGEEPGGGEVGQVERRFAPHLQRVNLGFNLSANSGILEWLGLGGGDGSAAEEEDDVEDEPFSQRSATDETSILPGRGTDTDVREARGGEASRDRRGGQNWRANFSYSLNRPRAEDQEASQLLQVGLDLDPTEQWEMSWDTSYDLEAKSFNDHRIRLTRDLHRWQAHFDFMKTATGNWTFRFEVSLLDNSDLKFDYEQRNLDIQDRR